jgi:hypothetical protein
MRFAQASKGLLDYGKTKKRLEEIEQLALGLGMASSEKKKGIKRIVLGKEMPSITKIVNDVFQKEVDYRMLSAVVHGHLWALQVFSLKVVKKNQEIYPGVKGGYLEKNLEYSHISFLCVEAVTSLSQAALMKFKLFGFDIKQMASAYHDAIKQIGLR